MSTLPPDADLGQLRRARNGRRLLFTTLTVLLAASMVGALGVTSREVKASSGGYELTVVTGRISRPGLATPWSMTVRRPGGFVAETISVATTSDYFEIFDENGLEPEPVESVTDGELTFWTFRTPPSGDTLEISLDARIEPGVQLTSAKAESSVLEDGRPVVSVRYSTFVLP